MGAPKGNEFWKMRSKHGRDALFASPELLWESACEYFEWCNDNPIVSSKIQQVQTEVATRLKSSNDHLQDKVYFSF
jgi:hypothetical protein